MVISGHCRLRFYQPTTDLSRHDSAESDRGLTGKIFSMKNSDRTRRVIGHHPGSCFGLLTRHRYDGPDLLPDADKWNVVAAADDGAGEHLPVY